VTAVDDLADLAPTWSFARSDDGVLLVSYHHGRFPTPAPGAPFDPEFPGALPVSERLWTRLAPDDRNRVVILTGADGVFADAWEPKRTRGYYNATMWSHALRSVPRSLDAFLDLPTIVIGAANGPATVHAEYLLLCDIVVAGESATFGDTPHFMHGHVPGDGVNVVWPLLLGANRGRDFLTAGETIDAHRAHELGLVKEVVRDDELLPRCHEIAARLLRADQLTLRYTAITLRQHLKAQLHRLLPGSLALEGLAFVDYSLRVDG
jgi:enoyl-CoA hydratase/carnithine racemase